MKRELLPNRHSFFSTSLMLKKMQIEFNQILKTQKYLDVPEEYVRLTDYALFRSGQRLRSLLTLIGYAAICGDWHDPEIIRTAVLIEWFHKTSLVLDDILDEDDYRKGFPTLHKKYGQKLALMNGLVMLSRGYEHILKNRDKINEELINIFREGLDCCLVGQACDIGWDSETGNLETYFNVIKGKTASMSQLAMQACCILAHANKYQTQALTGFGFHIGMGYQILNDLKSVTGIEDKKGKGKRTDVDLRRPNVLSALAVERGLTPTDWQNDSDIKNSLIKSCRDLAENEFQRSLVFLNDPQNNFYKEYSECLDFMVSKVKDVWAFIDKDIETGIMAD